ncbi:MAG TPA: cell division FtsA domain-containing protein [Candidatus Dormibacteraeota bacterium]
MKFKLLNRKDDYYRHFSALDIGSDLVKVLVVRREGPDGIVLGVGREPQHPSAMSGGAIADIEAVIQACNRALEAAEDMAGVTPGQCVVGIAGELVKGFSSSIAYPREQPDRKVRESELRGMLQLVEKRALREAQHLLELERSYGDLEARLVHSAITSVRIDGYPVTTPIGFTGKNLEITVFNTFAPMTQVGAVDAVVQELDLELAAAVAHPYALARAAAGEEAWEQGGIFVDIGGGTTDVALLRDGGVEGTRMFNLGGRAFTRRIALALGLGYEEAEARKLRHAEGLLPEEQSAALSRLLTQDVEVLLQGLNLALKDLARGELLPSNIYVCGGGSLLPELMAELTKNAWTEGLPLARPARSRQLGPSDVTSVSDSTGQLQSPQDVGPMGLANHALRLEAEDRELVSSVMRNVLKAMKV